MKIHVIMDVDDDNYQSVNMDSETCIDDIDVQAFN